MASPNIIFYFSDQQRWDTLGCYGQKLPTTPVLDALAAEGTLFQHAFTCQPVCGPARACLQSGMYATEVNCHKNHRILPENMDTLARRLNSAGYLTAYVGKWHLASNDEASYRESAVPEARRGGYQYWMAADTLEMTSHGYNGYVFDGDMNRHDFVGHRVDCINAYAIDFLHQYAEKKEQRPFFLFVSQLDPHHQNDHNRYEGPDNSKRRFADYEAPPDLAGTGGDWRENFPDYLGQCNLLDQNVGKLMDTLEALGLKDNTVFLYSSDHGSHFRTRNAEYKRSCEDACLHIPLIAWGGPFQGRGSVSELVSLIDVPPTILQLAHAEIPGHYRGHSLVPLAEGRCPQWPDAVYAQISEAETGRTVRTAEYKYAVRAPEFHMEEPFSPVYVENKLYDLIRDPAERINLIDRPEYESVRQDMRRRLRAFMALAHEPEADIRPARTKEE
ncbi:MAG: sulfatase-like hydrolase/transferase [Clostridia bacterium]|nr:sulfatase-like hydrolase/transferase [Clostridia bacterium]